MAEPRTTRPHYRILSLDGGGIRGIMTAVWLDRLEQLLGKPVRDHIDLVAGTSTGGILACAVSMGVPASKIIELYSKRGREIFPAAPSRLWSRFSRTFVQGLSAPKYDDAGLTHVLQDVFGQTLFGDLAIKPTLITSYNTLTRQAQVFKNTSLAHQKLLVWEITKATASAPTYFPAHVMRISGADSPLIDGGLVANNPTACAIAEGVRVNGDARTGVGLRRFVVASMGTGQSSRPISISEARSWGPLEWAIPIIDVLMDGAGDATDYIVTQLMPEKQYFRLQSPLDKAYDDLDNADATNINALLNLANNYLTTLGGEKQLAALVRML